MARYLLDTDVIIDISRGNERAADYTDSLEDAAISIITAQELIVGARDKRDLALIDSLISSFAVEHIDEQVGRLAYELLKRYAISNGLRTFDSLIAAIALNRDRTLVSKNRKHFAMIEGLRLEVPSY